MDKLQEWLLSIPVKTLEECRTDRRDTSELGDSIFRDPARSTPAREPQLFIEPGRETPPSALASVEPEAPKEVTTKPATWPPERDPIAEEKTRRENRRLDVPPIDATETSYQAEMRRQEEMRRDRKRFGPTLPPIDLR
jgi:hypothetical protein